jgi:hypothetical protein
MINLGEKGLVYGSQAVAKGLERLFVEIDKYMGRSALKPHLRPSTYLNVAGGGLALPYAADKMKVSSTTEKFADVAGGHMFNKIWDYLEEYMAGLGGTTTTTVATQTIRYAAETPGGAPEFQPPLYGRKVSPEPVIKNHVRYSLALEG